MVLTTAIIIGFLVSLVISALVIFIVTKLFGETEGFGTALLAALIGSVIYSLAFYFIGSGIWASTIGGVAWLIALGSLYSIGWIKSFLIAVVIWLLAGLISYVLPTVRGPL